MRGLARFLYTHNPFYAISAASVIYGLRDAYAVDPNQPSSAWTLATFLAAYTVLLALTACCIVRLGKVWDDARTIALLVILMCVASSVSFDTLAMDDLPAASQVLVGGWLFSLVVLEGLQRGMGIFCPWRFRAPVYLLIGLFFVYPLYLGYYSDFALGNEMAWRVISFPLLAGGMTLCLLPLARRGRALFESGSGWRWPYYPWSVMFFLAIAVCGRTFFMTLSFQSGKGMEHSFGLYYLIPFGFALLLLLSEIAFADRRRGMQRQLIVLPWGLVLLSILHGSSGDYFEFLNELTRSIGSPLWLTVLATAGFNLLQWFRGERAARWSVALALVVLSGIGPSSVSLVNFELTWWPLAPLTAYQVFMLLRESSSWRFLKTWLPFNLMIVAIMANHEPTLQLVITSIHLLFAGVMIAAFAFHDDLAVHLRKLLAVWVASIAGVATTTFWFLPIPDAVLLVYLLVWFLSALAFWFAFGMRLWKWTAIGAVGMLILSATIMGFKAVLYSIPERAQYALMTGAGCFFAGAIISALKGKYFGQEMTWLQSEWAALLREWRRRRIQAAVGDKP